MISVSTYATDCPEGTYFRRAHERSSYYRSDGTFVSAAKVKASCVEKRFGHDFWIRLLKGGKPKDWPHKETATKWSDNEKERVLEALSVLPEIFQLKSLKGIYRLSKSKDFPNPASHAPNIVVLYDSAFENKRNLARIVSHELAHQIYQQLSAEDRRDYGRVAEWSTEIIGSLVYIDLKRSGYVEEDSKKDPDEDFANNIEYFLFNRKELEKKSPKVHGWLKRQFGDRLNLRGRK